MSPLLHSCPNEIENFPEHEERSKRNEGTTEIMEMLVVMRKEMEEREDVGATATNQRGIFRG